MKSIFDLFRETANSFEGQESGEVVSMLLRRHPIVIILRLLGLFLAFFIPIIITLVFINFIIFHSLFVVYLFLISLWALFIWIIAAYSFTMYTLDVWIVTDRRIIDSTQHGFFNRKVSELHLSRIQDISVSTDGVIQTFFKFGDLHIQTAGTEERFKFLQIPHPNRVKDEMMKIAFAKHHLNNV